MTNASLVAVLSFAAATLVAIGCNTQPGSAWDPLDPGYQGQSGGPVIPNGADPTCLADYDVRQAMAALADDQLLTEEGGTYLLPSMPDVPSECRHIIKDLFECALGDDQVGVDKDTLDEYTGRVGLAPEWAYSALDAEQRRWVSACMIQRLNYLGISVPILLEGAKDKINIDEDLRQDYPFAESTAWGDLFTGSAGEFAWICTEEDVWSICEIDLGEPWIDKRVCDGDANCGIHFVGRCGDVCTETPDGYWDCSAGFGFAETVRVRMETNTHPPNIGECE